MKSFLLALFSCLFFNTAYAQSVDDRYFDSNKRMSTHKQVKVIKHKQRHVREHRTKRTRIAARYAGETYTPDPVQWVAKRVARGVGEVLGRRPQGAPYAWCGFWLGRHLGILKRDLWLARNWAKVGSPAGKEVGSIVVWKHHVGIITDVSGARIRVLSGNDGKAVRNRWRNVGAVIAYRRI